MAVSQVGGLGGRLGDELRKREKAGGAALAAESAGLISKVGGLPSTHTALNSVCCMVY